MDLCRGGPGDRHTPPAHRWCAVVRAVPAVRPESAPPAAVVDQRMERTRARFVVAIAHGADADRDRQRGDVVPHGAAPHRVGRRSVAAGRDRDVAPVRRVQHQPVAAGGRGGVPRGAVARPAGVAGSLGGVAVHCRVAMVDRRDAALGRPARRPRRRARRAHRELRCETARPAAGRWRAGGGHRHRVHAGVSRARAGVRRARRTGHSGHRRTDRSRGPAVARRVGRSARGGTVERPVAGRSPPHRWLDCDRRSSSSGRHLLVGRRRRVVRHRVRPRCRAQPGAVPPSARGRAPRSRVAPRMGGASCGVGARLRLAGHRRGAWCWARPASRDRHVAGAGRPRSGAGGSVCRCVARSRRARRQFRLASAVGRAGHRGGGRGCVARRRCPR